MALVLFAAVSFQCSSTWRWLVSIARQDGQEDVENGGGELGQQSAIRISHSLPDLQSEPVTHEYVQEQKDNKKVKSFSFSFFIHSHSIEKINKTIFLPPGFKTNHLADRSNETSKFSTSTVSSTRCTQHSIQRLQFRKPQRLASRSY